MEYTFENEIALEIYYLITKELKIKMTPKGFKIFSQRKRTDHPNS